MSQFGQSDTSKALFTNSTTFVDKAILSTSDKPQNFGGPLPKFKWLVTTLLEELNKVTTDNQWYTNQSKRDRKLKVVDSFITAWRSTVGNDIYPAMALILPVRDRERVYNMKDLKLGKYLLEILKIPKMSPDYEHVMNWKQFTKLPGQYRKTSALSVNSSQQKMSTVCVELLKKRKQDSEGNVYDIDEVNEILDQLADYELKKDEQVKILTRVIDNMSFVELQYFFDILLKNRIDKGMENTILYYWHPDAVNYLSAVTSLRTVCYKLWDPSSRLKKNDLSINLGKPFKPQLSKRPNQNYTKIVQSLSSDFFIEEKMDGERIQVHYMEKGNHISYYSRKAMDYTFIYGDNTQWGCISPHLKFSSAAVKNCVLDGEMVTYDPQRDSFVPFGVLKGSAVLELKRMNSEKIIPNDNVNPRPFLMIFDLLYLNDTPMAQYPLYKRKEILKSILKQVKGYVEVIDAVRASNEDAIKASLTHAVERGSEGIILKKFDSPYLIDRRTELWTKIKPEYLEEFGENVDLVVIGRERSKKDKYLCGLRVTDGDFEVSKVPKFYSFCRVANGFDEDDYRRIDDLTRDKWKDIKDGVPPSNLIQFGKRLPTEWIDPRDSFVIEVKARSIDRSISKNYKTSTTLYNAYCRQIRADKSWEDSTTIEEYKQIKDARKSTTNKDQRMLSRKKKQLINQLKKNYLDEENWNELISSIKSNIFENLTFMVLSDSFHGNKRLDISEVCTILKQNGASITRNQDLIEDKSRLRIISDKRTIDAKELYRNGYDILKSSYVFDCLKNQKLIKVEPRHCFDVSYELLMKAAERVDRFDISYINKLTTDDLNSVFTKIEEGSVDAAKIAEPEGDDVEEGDHFKIEELNDLLMEISLFGGLKVLFVTKEESYRDNVEAMIMRYQIEMHNGVVVDHLKTANIVLVLEQQDMNVINKVIDIRKELARDLNFSDDDHVVKTKRLVTSQWFKDSIQSKLRVDQQDYPVLTPRS